MKFLTDVNASGTLARWLIKKNHDVLEVSEKNPRMTDDEILSWALSENRVF
jgi:predicted nuclease of predicted toxin-antitoxin system